MDNMSLEELVKQYDSDWLAILREIAKISDELGLDNADWTEAYDDTLLQEFDPWFVLKYALNILENIT